MPATKKTPVKTFRYPMYGLNFLDAKAWSDHLVECRRQRIEKQSFVCEVPTCDYTTSRKSDYNRHIKRKHGVVYIPEESDSTLDPGDFSDYVGSARKESVKPKPAFDLNQLGRTERKPTTPNPVFAPQKRQLVTSEPVKQSSFTITSPASTEETVKPRESMTLSITSPDSVISICSATISVGNNNVQNDTASEPCEVAQEQPTQIDLIIRNDRTFSFNDPSQNCPPFVFGFWQDTATQTDHWRIVRTEKEDTLEEVISEEEWIDY